MLKRVQYALIFLLGVNALLWLLTSIRYIAFPYSLDFGEGILLCQSSMLIRGENIYPPINDYPYIVSNYHPLYTFLTSIPFIFTSPALWSGRLLTLLSAIGCMVIVGVIVARLSGKREYGFLAAFLPLCLNYPYNWAFVYRVDYLGIFLSLLGLYLYIFPRKKGGIYWSLIPFALAFLTKISFILAPIACILDLFIKKERSKWSYLLAFIFAFGIPYLVLNLITDFGMFRHTLLYTANIFHLNRMIDGYRELFEYTLPLWMTIALSLAISKGTNRPVILIYAFLTLLSLITYGAEGSDSNYFIELIFILSIASTAWFPSFTEKSINSIGEMSLRYALIILLIAFCFQGRVMTSGEFGMARNLKAQVDSQVNVEKIIQNASGDVISEDATFLARTGKRMVFQPYIMSLLSRQGKWDQSRFVEDLKNGKFSLLVLRFDVNDPNHSDKTGDYYQEAGFDRFTDEMEQAIIKGYQKPFVSNIGRGKVWFIYYPKKSESGGIE